jgi:hypothetical protein
MPVRQQAAAARGKGPEEFERKKAILALVPFDLSTEGRKPKSAARGGTNHRGRSLPMRATRLLQQLSAKKKAST